MFSWPCWHWSIQRKKLQLFKCLKMLNRVSSFNNNSSQWKEQHAWYYPDIILMLIKIQFNLWSLSCSHSNNKNTLTKCMLLQFNSACLKLLWMRLKRYIIQLILLKTLILMLNNCSTSTKDLAMKVSILTHLPSNNKI